MLTYRFSLNENIRDYTIKVLLRLLLDEAVMSDCLVAAKAEATLMTFLQASDEKLSDLMVSHYK